MGEALIGHLCVGGPYDGTFYKSDSHRFVAHEIPMAQIKPLDPPPDTIISYARTEYREQHCHAADKVWTVWAPVDQDIATTMQMLVDGYRRPK